MPAQLIDGKAIAADVRQEVADEVAALKERTGIVPTLAVVLVGDNPASQTYVGAKGKACIDAGMGSITHRLPATATQEEVETLVRELNADSAVNGILVQLPLPKGLNERAVLDLISLNKDVDGFHPMNIGELVMKGRTPQFIPCTPAGCIELLKRSGIAIAGADAVVVGRSNIVGIPVAALLNNADATVTICHSRTKDLPGKVKQADIVVAAIGRPEFVKGDWLKPGCAVIDVGINAVPDATKKSGQRLVGDVAFDEACGAAGYITPVPGGVGPMTIAMLLKNTVRAFKLQHGLE
ncbi:MAG: bifunctional methylenetetrahydrofolate dehydrogenase/methenyltetrahydrofolate cyclohydrolase FolD [Anaerolineae bacterium]|jgi:5,10-methylene-tetrahydrofolate dehydrogenase/methenyl tetrahydrofolate cyclohydrolase|nr:bifunctional methylenetetrahydrofolate dehydrogenase/methenyltetrahydrofolate cyclohydrolase FolD [Anaerolineae bacterium]